MVDLLFKSLAEKYCDYQMLSVALAYHLKKRFQCERVSIFVRSSGSRFITLVAQGVEKMTIDVKPGEGLTGKAIQKKKSLIINDPAHDPRSLCRVRDHYSGFKTCSILIAPDIGLLGRPYGAVVLMNSKRGYFITEEMDLLKDMTWVVRKIRGLSPKQITNIWTDRLEREIADAEDIQS